LRETGYRLLMEALAASGNVAEALQVYEHARTVLRDELGVPPGPAIQEVHATLLAG
jgi:pentatricopeptide repeat protein